MQNTFYKSIAGRDLQFNRFLYPTRYTIKVDEPGSDGKQYNLLKKEGSWRLTENEETPEWLTKVEKEINQIIKEHESNF